MTDHYAIDARSLAEELREASEDDHYYGSWMGGSKASGGGPAPAKGGKGKEKYVPGGMFEDEDQFRQVKAAEMAVRNIPDHEELIVISDLRTRNRTRPDLPASLVNGPVPGKPYVEGRNIGTEHHAALTPLQEGAAKNGHIVHNHPGNGGLSTPDVAAAIMLDAKSVTAIGTAYDGTKIRYRLVRPEKGWSQRDKVSASLFQTMGLAASNQFTGQMEQGWQNVGRRARTALGKAKTSAEVKQIIGATNKDGMYGVLAAMASSKGWTIERTGWEGEAL